MDMPRAVQFRYFWLEILASPQVMEELAGQIDGSSIYQLRDEARAAYIAYVAGEKEKALKTSDPTLTEAERKARAKEEAQKEVRSALIRWFDFSALEIDLWLDLASSAVLSSAATDIDDANSEGEEAIGNRDFDDDDLEDNP